MKRQHGTWRLELLPGQPVSSAFIYQPFSEYRTDWRRWPSLFGTCVHQGANLTPSQCRVHRGNIQRAGLFCEGTTTALPGSQVQPLREWMQRSLWEEKPMHGAIQLKPGQLSPPAASQGGGGGAGSWQSRLHAHCGSCEGPCCFHTGRATPPEPSPPPRLPSPPKPLLQPQLLHLCIVCFPSGSLPH